MAPTLAPGAWRVALAHAELIRQDVLSQGTSEAGTIPASSNKRDCEDLSARTARGLGLQNGVQMPQSIDNQLADLLDELIVEPFSPAALARRKHHGTHG